jgi:hypothetical protein
MKATIIGCAVVLFAGLPITTAQAAEEKCETPLLTSETVRLAEPGKWSYTYQVSWCVDEGRITFITPHVTHEADGTTCVWVTNAEEYEKPVPNGAGAWETFNMSEFSCKNSAGRPASVTPWAKIIIQPNGASHIPEKGIGDRIVE